MSEEFSSVIQNKHLQHENNILHIDSISLKEDFHFLSSKYKTEVKQLQDQLSQSNFLVTQLKQQIWTYESELDRMRIKMDEIMDQNNSWAIMKQRGIVKKKSKVERKSLTRSTPIPTKREKENIEPLPKIQDLEILNACIQQRDKYKEENDKLHSLLASLKERLRIRDEEIVHLLQQKKSMEAMQMEKAHFENTRMIDQLVKQIHFLQDCLDQERQGKPLS